MENYQFLPPFYLRSGMFQTILNSLKFSSRENLPLLKNSKEYILETKGGIKLKGYLSKQTNVKSKGLVVFLHGWEGSSESEYVVKNGSFLYKAGYDVFRLNMRDHGDSHNLNKGIFFGTLIEELFDAVKIIIEEYGKGQKSFIVGYSLGANYAVRIASKSETLPIKGLKKVVAINPPVDPLKATINIDKSFLIRKNFVKKWKRSLQKKMVAFPDIYDFSETLELDSCMKITRNLVEKYSNFKSAEEYFSEYTLSNGWIEHAGIDTLILMSEDDPIIDSNDFENLKLHNRIKVVMQRYGGHCGYFYNIALDSWYEEQLVEFFKN